MAREAKWRSKRPPMVGASPEDHEDELSESDGSEANSEHVSSPATQSNGQRDGVMDVLGDALQSSWTASTHATSKRYSIDEAAQQALVALKEQRQQDALSGSIHPSFEPAPVQPATRSIEGYSAPSPNDSSSEGSASPDTPQNGAPLFGNLDRPPTGPNFSSFLSDPPTTTTVFGNISLFDPNKSPAELSPNRDRGFGATRSHGSRTLLREVRPPRPVPRTPAVEQYEDISDSSSSSNKSFQNTAFHPPVNVDHARPYAFKWPMQMSADQVESVPATRPPPKSLFDTSFTEDVNFFSQSGTTISQPIKSTSPFPPVSTFGKGKSTAGFKFSDPTGRTSTQLVQSDSPLYQTAKLPSKSALGKSSAGGFILSEPQEKTHAQPFNVSTPSVPPKLSSFYGDPIFASDSFRRFHAQSSQSSISRLSEASSTENVGDETQGGTLKGLSEHLKTPEDLSTDGTVSTKHLFGQPRFDFGASNSGISFKFGVDAHPGPSDSQEVIPHFNSSGEFITAALQNLAPHQTNNVLITEGLTSLYESVMSSPDELASNTKNLDQCNKAISDIDARMLYLNNAHGVVFGGSPKGDKGLHELLLPLQDQKEHLQRLLRTNKIWHREHQDNFLAQILYSLELFAKYSGRPSDADSDTNSNSESGRQKDVSGDPADDDYVQELLSHLAWYKEGNRKTKEEAKAEWGEKIKSVQQKAATRYRAELVKKLAKCSLDKYTALRQLKDQYATRMADAETKSRLHKKATAKIEELETTVRRLEREKSEMILAKATVENEMEELETQAKDLQGYQEAYSQIVHERDQLQSEYYDMLAERDELRQAQGAIGEAPDHQDVSASVQATSILQTGTLQSYETDLNLLENYWTRQENFAEMAMRETAAEIRDVEAKINEAVRQLRLLGAPNDHSDAESDAATVLENEAKVESQPSLNESFQPQLLDTLTHPLNTPQSQAQISQSTARAPKARRPRPTWAKKAAIAKDSDNGTGQGYVHTSYHGHGVSTVKRIDPDDTRR